MYDNNKLYNLYINIGYLTFAEKYGKIMHIYAIVKRGVAK